MPFFLSFKTQRNKTKYTEISYFIDITNYSTTNIHVYARSNLSYSPKYYSISTIPRANNDRTNRKTSGALTAPYRRFKTVRVINGKNRQTPGALTTPNCDSMSRNSDCRLLNSHAHSVLELYIPKHAYTSSVSL